MSRRKKFFAPWRTALGGAALCATLGILLLWLGGWPVWLSYDLLFLVRETPPLDDVVIIYMDDPSFKRLHQSSTPNWDRNLHAELLNRLTADQSRLVVFDVVFSEPGTPEANTNLAQAIRRNGKVVLAAALDHPGRAQISVSQPLLPLPEFQDAAAGWGIAELDMTAGPGHVARRYYGGTEVQPSLPWVAAKVAGAVSRGGSAIQHNTCLNFYGPAISLPHLSYCDVTNEPVGYFRNKCVFVGAGQATLKARDEADQFRTPYTLWTGEYTPGVEIGATAFLNLLRGDGFTRLGAMRELLVVLAAGIVFGGLLGLLRPITACAAAFVSVILILIIAAMAARHHVWFAWTVVAFAQIPVALLGSLRNHFHQMKFEKEVLERTLVETSRLAGSAANKLQTSEPAIPDHELVRCVGKGAYGEVWLARNAVGVFHAVKIVRRRQFSSNEPYEREFKGIQKFMPISRSHPGLVNILHVGRNDPSGFFFYIMEAADDQTSRQQIDSSHYSPKSLAGELVRHGRLPPEECLQLGLALSDALGHLHQHQLVHRDIKPGNIIYVNDAPKIADIGLVTEQCQKGQNASLVGTDGYIPPEGPGSPAADVFALGKVLYEACMGRDRQLFPEVPTAVWEQPDDALLRRLNEVIFHACNPSVEHRYRSAADLHAALSKLRRDASQATD